MTKNYTLSVNFFDTVFFLYFYMSLNIFGLAKRYCIWSYFIHQLSVSMRLKITLRGLLRYRLNSSIIVISLSIGIACMNLIAQFLVREFNVDGFQKNKNRIYALQSDDPWNKGQKMYFIRYGAAEYMKDNFSEVEDYCRVSNAGPTKVRVNNHDYFDDNRTIAVSVDFNSAYLSCKLMQAHEILISE